MTNFMNNLQKTYNNRLQMTENGAVGYSTTGKELLDFNYKIGSYRNMEEREIKSDYARTYFSDPIHAVKMLFYVGDIRGGMGERRTFNICLNWLAKNKPEIITATLPLIPEYTRWDYLVKLIEYNNIKKDVVDVISKQLKADMQSVMNNKTPSICAKWMPSENTSSYKTRSLAKEVIEALNVTPKAYRKMLSRLRKALNEGVVERYMSSRNWKDIDYSKVCSKANLKYNKAFMKRDEARRIEYLDSLEKGKTKINASVLFPHDIVHSYSNTVYSLKDYDIAIENMWKSLPDYVNGDNGTLVVGDGSGSMYLRISPPSNVMAVDVANALAIYFAERASGQFKNTYITFGGNPHIVDFSKCKTLRDKIMLAKENEDCMNTDIAKVFRLILRTAVDNNMPQEDMPKRVLIISDGEFDGMCYASRGSVYSRSSNDMRTLFGSLAEEFNDNGYRLPKLVFWNVNSRTCTIPIKENDAGVVLVSGFSPAIVKMVLSNNTDPYKALLEQIDSERYQPVEDAIKGIA